MRLPLLAANVGLCAGLVLSATPAYGAARPNAAFLSVTAYGGTTMKGVFLQCPGATEGHPYGEAACAALDAVDGELDRLPSRARRVCAARGSVTATMDGMWRNRPVGWQKTFSSVCDLYAQTGAIFRF
ncbi:SSI family serine proteinase inhibitor [Nonomuraea sp. NPDC049421]|uniref:SSI family serine proteinase inhibitor n=1 Tax=Nonomuraea sp. NPDC049421 TaxID=3155275 RepID=UPI0034252B2B